METRLAQSASICHFTSPARSAQKLRPGPNRATRSENPRSTALQGAARTGLDEEEPHIREREAARGEALHLGPERGVIVVDLRRPPPVDIDDAAEERGDARAVDLGHRPGLRGRRAG
jgi:hypothetical protein